LLEGHSPRIEMLAAYGRVDILLDPFPYPGGTTTMEALWMGVPCVTHRGHSMLSRGGESIAYNAGLADWIAGSDEEYVATAVAAAADLDRLAALRAGLRRQILTSPMCNAARFARHLEAALWGMWEARVQAAL
jgi:predicted O-linked N-acetylglucosamine transferase (SPINDLY family)